MSSSNLSTGGKPNKAALHRPHLRAGYIDPVVASGRKPRAAILARKSHSTEGRSKSVREQVIECQQVCEVMGFERSEERMYIEPDGMKGEWWWPESGHEGPYRRVLGQLIQDIRDGLIDVLVIWRSDRLYRNVGLAHEILKLMVKHNVRFVSSRHDYHIHEATGMANAKQEAVRNEEMVAKTSEDIIRDLGFKKDIGQITRSPACLGFRSAGNDTLAARAIPEEIELVRRMFRMFAIGEDDRGPLCRNEIARQLESEGVQYPRVRRLDKGEYLESINGDRVEKTLRHVAYVGKMRHAGIIYDCDQFLVPATDGSGRKETVVPLSLWQLVQDRLDRETKADKRSGKTSAELTTPHLLTGTVVCGICGRNCYALGGFRREGVLVSPFKLTCINREGTSKCPRGAHRRTPQEAIVEQWVMDELFPALAAEQALMQTDAGRDADVQRLAALRQQIEQAEVAERRKLRRALDALDEGAMDQDQYNQLAQDMRAEREVLSREVETLDKRLTRANQGAPDLSADAVAKMSRSALRAAVQASLAWISISAEGLVAHTRWGTYSAARFRRPVRGDGEHWSINRVGKVTPIDSLEALSFLPEPERFIQGRRRTLGDAAEALSDEMILPGWTAKRDGEADVAAEEYLPEVVCDLAGKE